MTREELEKLNFSFKREYRDGSVLVFKKDDLIFYLENGIIDFITTEIEEELGLPVKIDNVTDLEIFISFINLKKTW